MACLALHIERHGLNSVRDASHKQTLGVHRKAFLQRI